MSYASNYPSPYELPKAAALAACIPGLARITATDSVFLDEYGSRGRSLTDAELARRDALFDGYVPGRTILGNVIPRDAVYTVVFRTRSPIGEWRAEDEVRHFAYAEDLAQWYIAQLEWASFGPNDFAYLLFDVVDGPALLSSAFLPDLAAALEAAYV